MVKLEESRNIDMSNDNGIPAVSAEISRCVETPLLASPGLRDQSSFVRAESTRFGYFDRKRGSAEDDASPSHEASATRPSLARTTSPPAAE